MIITSFQTQLGVPHTTYTPTISIWRVTDNVKIIDEDTMTSISNGLYKYQFNSLDYGSYYSYIITGDPTTDISERLQTGSFVQETPDRTYGTVVTDVENSTLQFKTDLASSTTDIVKDALLLFVTGNQTLAPKKIAGYNGTTKIITLNTQTPFPVVPQAGDRFVIIAL